MADTRAWQWETIAPGDAGIDARIAERLSTAVRDGRVPHLHGVVVARNGRLVLEHYGEGQDFSWGTPHGHVKFRPDTLHDLRSVSKSIVAMVYGIALSEGLVPDPSAPLLGQFPEYTDLASDERRRLTIEHALTMTLGIEWREDLPYTTPDNAEIAMEMAEDRYRFVLERPIVEEPGQRWHYCGGASALIGALIERGTQRRLPDYAKFALFDPLGIEAFEWMSGRDGIASPASGLRLRPRDVARIGHCIANGGAWQSRQVVPVTWMEAMMTPRVTIAPGFDYGYQWYLGAARTPHGRVRWVAAQGNGGQRLFVAPELDLVVVVTAGGYDTGPQFTTPAVVINEVVLPSLQS